MKTMKYILASALCMLVSIACSGSKKSESNVNEPEAQEATAEAVKKDGKALVVFFSHAGDNYSVGDIKVGNTKIVADYISELTGADQFEIKTSKYDGMAYRPLCDLAKEEQQKGELPPFEGSLENLVQYDTVFIGGPVWWGTYPQVMFTFFSQYDLNDKTIIPFTTHEGSGLGNCVKDVKKTYPNATVTGEFAMFGHDVRSGKKEVEKWLNKIGF
ncbi:MAG: NAD(P)H-dependent oxidoreductase [Bacteroidaceae bacterium]|nr:NAD(P)H-dependent oxidoreductase [Bacteroidaceae bacterium]